MSQLKVYAIASPNWAGQMKATLLHYILSQEEFDAKPKTNLQLVAIRPSDEKLGVFSGFVADNLSQPDHQVIHFVEL